MCWTSYLTFDICPSKTSFQKVRLVIVEGKSNYNKANKSIGNELCRITYAKKYKRVASNKGYNLN